MGLGPAARAPSHCTPADVYWRSARYHACKAPWLANPWWGSAFCAWPHPPRPPCARLVAPGVISAAIAAPDPTLPLTPPPPPPPLASCRAAPADECASKQGGESLELQADSSTVHWGYFRCADALLPRLACLALPRLPPAACTAPATCAAVLTCNPLRPPHIPRHLT